MSGGTGNGEGGGPSNRLSGRLLSSRNRKCNRSKPYASRPNHNASFFPALFKRKKAGPYGNNILDLETPLFSILMKQISHSPRMGINALCVMILCIIGLIITGLTSLPFNNPVLWLLNGLFPNLPASSTQMLPETILYHPQLAFGIFCGALLGPDLGGLAVLGYLLIGLLFQPVFANGGGLAYFSQPGMGYLLGMLVSAYGAGKRFNRFFSWHNPAMKKPRGNSFHLLLIACGAIITVHLLGGLYLLGLALFSVISWQAIVPWFTHLTLEPFLYDLLLTLLLTMLVRWIRLILWIGLY